MATHVLPCERRTLHGTFDERTPPVLVVSSGDTVELSTLDAHWYEPVQPALAADPDAELVPWVGLDRVRDPGHALSGPIAVVGAKPGDVVEVRLLEVVPGAFGWTRAGGWSSPPSDWLRSKSGSGSPSDGIEGATSPASLWTISPDSSMRSVRMRTGSPSKPGSEKRTDAPT